MISPTCASGEWAIDLAESYQLHQQCNGWIVTLEGLKRCKCVHHGMTFGGPASAVAGTAARVSVAPHHRRAAKARLRTYERRMGRDPA